MVLTEPSSIAQPDVAKYCWKMCGCTSDQTNFALCFHSFDLKALESTSPSCMHLELPSRNSRIDIILAFSSQSFVCSSFMLLCISDKHSQICFPPILLLALELRLGQLWQSSVQTPCHKMACCSEWRTATGCHRTARVPSSAGGCAWLGSAS